MSLFGVPLQNGGFPFGFPSSKKDRPVLRYLEALGGNCHAQVGDVQRFARSLSTQQGKQLGPPLLTPVFCPKEQQVLLARSCSFSYQRFFLCQKASGQAFPQRIMSTTYGCLLRVLLFSFFLFLRDTKTGVGHPRYTKGTRKGLLGPSTTLKVRI